MGRCGHAGRGATQGRWGLMDNGPLDISPQGHPPGLRPPLSWGPPRSQDFLRECVSEPVAGWGPGQGGSWTGSVCP